MPVPLSAESSKRLKHRVAELIKDRESWHAHWTELSENIVPWRGRNLQDKSQSKVNDGQKKNDLIMDSAATDALSIMAAGLQSGLTSPARPWFRMGFSDSDLNESPSVRAWLDDAESVMFDVLSKSNAYNSLHQIYTEIATFATACMDIVEDFSTVIKTRAYTIGEYYATSTNGVSIDTVVTFRYMTLAQIEKKFGKEAFTQEMQSAWDNGTLEMLKAVVQIVEPDNGDMPDLKSFVKRPFRSIVYYPEKDLEVIDVGGFDEFPFLVPRWSVISEDKYGSECPGMNALPDIKMLHKMQEKSLVALDKVVDPPVKAPPGMKNEIINTMPGGVTYATEMQSGSQGMSPLYEVKPDINAVETKIIRVEQKIRRGFFNDLFLMLANLPDQPRTATEIVERKEEKLLMLGPFLDRLFDELLRPFVDRLFNICFRAGLFADPPLAVRGREVEVEFISVLAQAQRAVKLQATNNFVAAVGQLSALYPEALDKIDPDDVVEELHAGMGVTPDVLRDDDEVEDIRRQRSQLQQAQQSAELIEQAAGIAKTAAQAQDTAGGGRTGDFLGTI